MGCVPSTASPPAVQTQPKPTSSTAPKAVELPVRTQPGQTVAYSAVAQVEDTPAVVAPPPDPSPAKESDQLLPAPILQPNPLPSRTYGGDDELLLDFETFLLLPDVQAVILDRCVEQSTLQELFQIVDKNMDGLVNDKEREDLLELISLSYGKNSPRHSMNASKQSGLSEPSPTQDAAQPTTQELQSPPVPAPSVEPTAEAQSSAGVPPPAPAAVDVAAAAAAEAPATTTVSPKTRDGRAKPKIIKFIAPQLVEPTAAAATAADAAPSAEGTSEVKTADSTSSKSGKSSPQSGEPSPSRESPRQKKGFMLAKRESFNKMEVISAAESRFFVLDNGFLSYMDSTSKKPPFSMSQRNIDLKNVTITVNKNVIELAPLRRLSQSGSESDDAAEIVVLELKGEKECQEWMKAIEEHLAFSTAVAE